MAASGDGRRVVVTGGGRGLGAAIVGALAAAGHDVLFTFRSAATEARALREHLAIACPDQSFTATQVDLAFLLSPAASYITGAILPVDGGLSAAIGIHR